MPATETMDLLGMALWFFLIAAFVLFGVYVWRGIRTSSQVNEIQARRDYGLDSSPKPAVRESLFAAFLCWSVCVYATNVYVQRAFTTEISSTRVTFHPAADLSTGRFSPPVSVSFIQEWDGEFWSVGSHYYSPPDRAHLQLHTPEGFQTLELSGRSDPEEIYGRVRDALALTGDEPLAAPIASAAIKLAVTGAGESFNAVNDTLLTYKHPLESFYPSWTASAGDYTTRRASWVTLPFLVVWGLGVAVMYRRRHATRERTASEGPMLSAAASVHS